nr:dash complex subunit dad3 [Quercus suber]
MDVPTRGRNDNSNHEGELSQLEQEILDEYSKLVGNLDDLSGVLAELAAKPSAEILDALRGLERKTTTVFTLLKASVYSIVLQQEIYGGEQGSQDGVVLEWIGRIRKALKCSVTHQSDGEAIRGIWPDAFYATSDCLESGTVLTSST